jgi:hypothetical protein
MRENCEKLRQVYATMHHNALQGVIRKRMKLALIAAAILWVGSSGGEATSPMLSNPVCTNGDK